MKRILIALTIVLAVASVFAQDNVSNDTARDLIQDGRDEIVRQIINDDFNNAVSTLNELEERFGNNYIILYPREEFLVEFATRKFNYLANGARVYVANTNDDRQGFVFNDFRNELVQHLSNNQSNILRDLEETEMSDIDNEIIQIYMHYLFNDDVSALNKLINTFEKEHSRSSFSSFLQSLKRFSFDSRINFSIGYNSEYFGENFSNSYSSSLNLMKIELDGFVRKTYFSVFIGGGFTDRQITYSLLDENNEISEVEEDKISSLKYGVKLGRIILSSNTFKIYPYVSVGGFEICPSSVLFDERFVSETVESKIGSFFAGTGLSADIVLKRWNPKHMYDPEGYFFIRPNVGYNYLISEEELFTPNNLYFSVSLGVSVGPKN